MNRDAYLAEENKYRPRLFIPRRYRAMPQPPGPRESFPFSHLFEIRREGVFRFLMRQFDTHGPLVRLTFGPVWLYLVNEPALVQQLLQKEPGSVSKGYIGKIISKYLGHGLFTSEGAFHRNQRRTIQPSFQGGSLRRYSDGITACVQRLEARWQSGQQVDIFQEMNRLTLDIVLHTLFTPSQQVDFDEVAENFDVLVNDFPRRFSSPFALFSNSLPTPSNRQFWQARERLNQCIQRFIDEYRATGEDRGDLLSMLIFQPDINGNLMPDAQVRDEAITMFLAGHETTALALAWAWHQITLSESVQAQLQHEVDAALGGHLPSHEDLPSLPYCRQLFQESLRLHSPVYSMFRQALQDIPLGEFTAPRGSLIILSPYAMHRDPRFYDEPLRFKPERWTEEFQKALPKFAYYPFGGGPRVCIGEPFAWAEGILALATLAQRWRMSPVTGPNITLGKSATLRPEHPVLVRVEERKVRAQSDAPTEPIVPPTPAGRCPVMHGAA